MYGGVYTICISTYIETLESPPRAQVLPYCSEPLGLRGVDIRYPSHFVPSVYKSQMAKRLKSVGWNNWTAYAGPSIAKP